MTVNLMDTVKGMFTSEAVDKAATTTGESPDGMRQAMHGAVPAIFAGLTQAVGTPTGAARIFGAITDKSGASSQGLMSAVFGDKGSAVTGVLAKGSGVKSEAASHALSFALPLVMGVLGKHVTSNGLTAGGISQLLAGHKEAIQNDPHTPPGLAGALGLGSLSGLGRPSAELAQPRVSRTEGTSAAEAPKRPRWGIILPALGLGALIIWGLASATRSHAPAVGVTAPQPPAPPAATLHAPPAPGPIALPGGKTLDVAPDSVEAQMAHGLSDGSLQLPHTYEPEHLTFDYDSSTITPTSAKTINDLALMLDAYPTSRIRVVGHTDSTGTTAANQPLSEARAKAIKDALVAKGIAADRIEIAGEAARQPAPGAKPEEATNRRAEVVLLSR
jgi:outer membrane protein OmpA-like peptidoglycan-associated protein